MKIVSLLPSATEIVCALGLADDLAGVTFECDHPAEAVGKPVVSHAVLAPVAEIGPAAVDSAVAASVGEGEPIYRLDEERIRAIQPDLILAQDLCRVCAVPSGQVEEALEGLGCSAEVLSLDPNTLDDVIDCIVAVGRATGTDARAERLAGALRDRVERVRAEVAGLPRARVLALEWSDPPFTAGHWVPEMVAIAGGTEVLGHAGTPSRRATWDEVRAAGAEALAFIPCGYDLAAAVAEGRALLPRLQDMGIGRAWAFDATAYFSRPGPRLVDGVEALAGVLHPGAVPAAPPDRVTVLL